MLRLWRSRHALFMVCVAVTHHSHNHQQMLHGNGVSKYQRAAGYAEILQREMKATMVG